MQEQELLKGIYLFRELSPKETDLVISISKERKYKKDAFVFREGDQGDAFYVVVSGSIRISTMVPGVGEEALTVLRSGEYFGEMALIDDAPRSAGAIANEDTILISISKVDFQNLLARNTELAYKLLWVFTRTLCNRLRKTDEQLKSIFAIAKNF